MNDPLMQVSARRVTTSDRFHGARAMLRLLTLDDCSERYVQWLNDPEVSRYLETRFACQSIETVRSFVSSMIGSPSSYLFAIVDVTDGVHVGNLKIGPINPNHSFADVSYFIGERARWGKGLATDAIKTSVGVGFDRLQLHRLQAGVYEKNSGSARALERAGFTLEGRFKRQLRGVEGEWEDHLWYGRLRNE